MATHDTSIGIIENPLHVYDPDSIVRGETIAEWTGNWWTWALQAPLGNGPLNSTSPAATHYNNDGKMFFIAGGQNATITVPNGTPILFPLINAFDTEGPGIETIPGFVAGGNGSYADESLLVTNLAQQSIYDAHATLTKDGQTLLDVHLTGSDTAKLAEKSGIFALGPPQPNSFLANALTGADISSIPNLPFTSSSGDWLALGPLQPGTYTLDFGGTGHAVSYHGMPITSFPEGWGAHTTDTLIVGKG